MMLAGIIRLFVLIAFEGIILYKYMGQNAAIVMMTLIIICAFLTEPIMVRLVDKAVPFKRLDQYTFQRLAIIKEHLVQEIKRVEQIDVSTLKIYVFDRDDVFVSKAYGIKSVGISKSMLQLDDGTLCAVIANEIAHGLRLDHIFNRVLQMNLIVGVLMLMGTSYLTIAILWICFLVLCLFRKVSIGSYIMTNLMSKGIKALFKVIEQIIMLVCSYILKLVNSWNVYKADKFVTKLGFGNQLTYYLRRFASNESSMALFGGYPVNMLPNIESRIDRIKKAEVLRVKHITERMG